MKRILIVDDDPAYRDMLREILSPHMSCDLVGVAKEAASRFEAALAGAPYDVVLLDISMPDEDGLAVLQAIRQLESLHHVPPHQAAIVVMCSSFKEPFVSAFKLGCDDYVLKPIEVDLLLACINRHLVLRENRRIV